MSKWVQGKYTLTHPEKYVGNTLPTYRSSWEMAFFRFCDNHPSVIQWASEAVQIPYRNPLTGKQTIYVPDVFVKFQDKNGQQRMELIEIKPSGQVMLREGQRATEQDRATIAINHAKWKAAAQWCRFKNISFRIVTEKDLFRQTGRG